MKKIKIILTYNLIILTPIVIISACKSKKQQPVEDDFAEYVYEYEEDDIDSSAIKRQQRIQLQKDLYSHLIDFDNLDRYFETILVEKLEKEEIEAYEEEYEEYGDYEEYEDESIVINGYEFGKYEGTMFVFLYGEYEKDNLSFIRCVTDYLSEKQKLEETSDFYVFKTLSGIPPFSSDNPRLPFKNVNPRFIEWAAENLIPDPDLYVYDYACQQLYDGVLEGFFRKFVLSYVYLHQVYGIEKYAKLYREKIQEDPEGCIDFLYNELGIVDQVDFNGEKLIFQYNDYVFTGFWLRRHLDGSEQVLKEALDKLMTMYDSYWYSSTLDEEVDYHKLSKTAYIKEHRRNYNLNIGQYYQILDEKIYLFDHTSLLEHPEEYTYTYNDALVVRLDSVTTSKHSDGSTIQWAKCFITSSNKKQNKWILSDHLDSEIKNFAYFDSLRLEGGFDTIGSKIHFRLSVVNNTKYDIEIPEGEIKRTTRRGTSSSTENMMDTERIMISAGKKVDIINDEVIMGGYNKTNVWYAPKSKSSLRIVPLSKNSKGERYKGLLRVEYNLIFNKNSSLKTQPLKLEIQLPISMDFVKEKYR